MNFNIDDKKVNKPLIYTAIAATVLTLIWVILRFFVFAPEKVLAPTPSPTEEAVFCTQDAKLCPDGSYVGRTPPDCEFEACPASDSAQLEENNVENNLVE